MIGVLLKHCILESAIERMFDNIDNNFASKPVNDNVDVDEVDFIATKLLLGQTIFIPSDIINYVQDEVLMFDHELEILKHVEYGFLTKLK